MMTRFARRQRSIIVLIAGLSLVTAAGGGAAAQAPAKAPSVAFLGVQFTNDKSDLEPTSSGEAGRGAKVAEFFASEVAKSGRYEVVPVPADVAAKIEAGQPIGECGGCELDFGRSLQADLVAWASVEKVSNLILFMNIYMRDVASGEVRFFRSVNIRSNSDESWLRAMGYVLKNYLLAEAPSH